MTIKRNCCRRFAINIAMLAGLTAILDLSATYSRAGDDPGPMVDISLSCPPDRSGGTIEVIAKNLSGLRTIDVTFIGNRPSNVKLYFTPVGLNRRLLNDLDLADVSKMSSANADIANSAAAIGVKLKKEICEGDSETRKNYFATLKRNEMQFSSSVEQGHWFVIFGAWPPTDAAKVNARMTLLSGNGITAQIVKTDDYPKLTPGLRAVVVGPISKEQAQARLQTVQSIVPDAFIKEGF